MRLLSDDVRLVPLVDRMDDPAHTPVLYAFELRRDPDPVLHRAPAPGRSEDAGSSAQEVIARIVTVRIDDDTGATAEHRLIVPAAGGSRG